MNPMITVKAGQKILYLCEVANLTEFVPNTSQSGEASSLGFFASAAEALEIKSNMVFHAMGLDF